MKLIIETYPDGCRWCNGVGHIKNPSFDPNLTSSTLEITCPVCNGSKIIIITKTYEPLYEVTFNDKPTELFKIPDSTIKSIREIHAQSDHDQFAQKHLHKCDDIAWRPIRERLRLSLRQVSKSTGVSASTISRIEHGKECFLSNVEKLSNFYNGKNN